MGESTNEPGDASRAFERTHPASWSANLEAPRHADDPEVVVEEAIEAIEHTASGYHVNLVTHGALGHPSTFLYPVIESIDGVVKWEYVDQCGCGGHVTRVHVA